MKRLKTTIIVGLLLMLKVNAQSPIDSLMHAEGIKQFKFQLIRAQSAKDYELCINIVDSLIAMEPDNAEFYLKKGYYYSELDNFDTYLNLSYKALELGYDSLIVYDDFYLFYSIKEDYDKALFYAKEMVNMKPDSANLYLNIASVYIGKYDYKSYVKYTQIAIDKGSEVAKETKEYLMQDGTWQKYDD